MKTALLPSVRVADELRRDAEKLLHGDENLSGFIAEAVKEKVARRKAQEAFVARGLASARKARATGVYYSVEETLGRLEDILAEAQARESRR